MKTSQFHQLLAAHPDAELAFVLPDGGRIAPHAHITEVGRVEKTFLDCGGARRKTAACTLQAWEADDVDHRLPAGKLAQVLDRAAAVIGSDDPPVEIEFQAGFISQFPVTRASFSAGVLRFDLGVKNTDCLAPDVCLPGRPSPDCGGGASCC